MLPSAPRVAETFPESVRVHSLAQAFQDWRVVHEVVVHEDEHQQGGPEMPGEFVVVRQLADLAGAGHPERRGRDVQMWEFLGGELLQPNVKFLGDGNLECLHIGIADHGDVTACRGPLEADGFAVHEAQTVGSRLGPEIKVVRPTHIRVGFVYCPDIGRPG